MSETTEIKPMSLNEAAKSVGMPEATPDDVRTPEGRAKFEQSLNPVSERAAEASQRATGRRPMSLGKRAMIGVAGTVALLSPQGQEAVDTVQDKVVEAAKSFNDNLDNDRLFNPDAGNPENTEEIVESWNQNPSQTVVTVETPAAEATQTGPSEISPEAVIVEREVEG